METVTNCNALKMRAADGKMRLTDIADTEFRLVGDNAAFGGYFAGCNFWGWVAFALPKHEQWQVGDDYTGDPAPMDSYM